MLAELANRRYFFDRGLRFACRRCGRCCTGRPGIVRITRDEIQRISRYLETPVHELIRHHLLSAGNAWHVREHPDGRCLFYRDGCVIYPVRPRQCETFPFWSENLRSRERWERIARDCPGIGEGTLAAKEQILKILSEE